VGADRRHPESVKERPWQAGAWQRLSLAAHAAIDETFARGRRTPITRPAAAR
jgi:hypothetical protein